MKKQKEQGQEVSNRQALMANCMQLLADSSSIKDPVVSSEVSELFMSGDSHRQVKKICTVSGTSTNSKVNDKKEARTMAKSTQLLFSVGNESCNKVRNRQTQTVNCMRLLAESCTIKDPGVSSGVSELY